MNALHYYAQRTSIKDGETAAPVVKFGNGPQMERQFHLFCASACINEAGYDLERVEWGTVEHGVIETKMYNKAGEN